MHDAAPYRFILENSPAALSCHTAGGVFLFASPACQSIFGRTPDELSGHSLAEIALPEDEARIRLRREEALEKRAAVSVRYRVQQPDQRVIWVETTMRAAASDDGVRLLCASRDVTAEEAAAAEIAAERERARLVEEQRENLIRLMPGLVWYGPISADLTRYHVTYMSDYLQRVTGYSPEEWIQTPGFWKKIIHPEDRDRVLAEVGKVQPAGTRLPPYRVFARDGRVIWLQSFMSIQRDAGGTPMRMYGLTLDITTYKDTELQIARQAERLAELSTPLIPVSEDILVMPLVGTIDPERAENILSTLLGGLSSAKVATAILDVTGVGALDAMSAGALLRAARAAELLGARVVLTGIRPEVARTLLGLGLDLRGLATRRTLASAFAEISAGAARAPRAPERRPAASAR